MLSAMSRVRSSTSYQNPAIDTVILRNSRGGDVAAGYRVGEMFRARGLRTAVSGYCNSSCSRMLLGGKERFFTSDYAPASTVIGFHGHYGSDGELRAALVTRYDLKSWIIQYSDGEADPDLVERWINLPRNNDMVRFCNPALFTVNRASTFLCLEGQRLQQCQEIHKTALDLGIALLSGFRSLLDRRRSAFRATHVTLPPSTQEIVAAASRDQQSLA